MASESDLKMTVDEAIAFADEWSRGMTLHADSQGWRVVCLLLADEVRRLRAPSAEAKELRRQIRIMQVAAERKNKELDAMHYVWCDGGCNGGTHRYAEGAITDELIARAERNIARMKKWLINNQHRAERTAIAQQGAASAQETNRAR